jgi:uncharacterized phage-associated protein
MSTVFDVANYILNKQGPMTAMKLQKLVYYAQAWSLVWDERPLFTERIEAWANGPVVPALFEAHRGSFQVNANTIPGKPETLDNIAIETIDAVLKYYGDKTSQWLSELTHSENPWKDARQGIPPGVRANQEITLASIHEYYDFVATSA